MSALLNELRERYHADITALSQEEIDLLCAFDEHVRAEQSQAWAERLRAVECEYKGLEITLTPHFPTDTQWIVEQLVELGFFNTRTYVEHGNIQRIKGNKRTWLDAVSQKSQTLYQEIHQHTGVKPLYVSWFAGEIVVDLHNSEEWEQVEQYLRTEIMLQHQHLIRDKDPLLSLGIVRLKIKDSLTERTLEA